MLAKKREGVKGGQAIRERRSAPFDQMAAEMNEALISGLKAHRWP
jgi:hypothetical protein